MGAVRGGFEAREWWGNSGEKEVWCFGRRLCERLGKLRWIAMKVVGVTQGSVMVGAEEFEGCPITRWYQLIFLILRSS